MSSPKPAVPFLVTLPEVAAPTPPDVPEMPPADTPDVPEMPPADTPEEAPIATLTLAQPLPTARPRAFYLASQWHILPAPGVDMIEATNNQTGDKYEGPISDFNEMLRGN